VTRRAITYGRAIPKERIHNKDFLLLGRIIEKGANSGAYPNVIFVEIKMMIAGKLYTK
jgi:hypothetical protein